MKKVNFSEDVRRIGDIDLATILYGARLSTRTLDITNLKPNKKGEHNVHLPITISTLRSFKVHQCIS